MNKADLIAKVAEKSELTKKDAEKAGKGIIHLRPLSKKTAVWSAVGFVFGSVALAFVLTRYTDMDIIRVYLCVQFIDIVKVFIGLLMLRSDFWARNVVSDV